MQWLTGWSPNHGQGCHLCWSEEVLSQDFPETPEESAYCWVQGCEYCKCEARDPAALRKRDGQARVNS